MYKRILSGTVLTVIAVISVIFKNVCLLVAAGLILVGLWEFFQMLEKKQVKLFKIFGLILGGLIPVSIFFQLPITREWQLFFILVGLFVLFLLELTRREKQETIFSLSGTVFGVLYVSWCFSVLS